MDKAINYVLERAAERSTWVGLATLLGAVGVGIFASPEAQGTFATLGLAIAGFVSVVLREKKD